MGEFSENNGENSGGLLGRVGQRQLEAQIANGFIDNSSKMNSEKASTYPADEELSKIRQELGIPIEPEKVSINSRLELENAFESGQTITIIRSDTTHDSGWSIIGFTQDGKINVIKEGVGQKLINVNEFIVVDPERLTAGSQVRVMRTGKPNPESGWHIESFKRNAKNDGMDVVVVSNDGNLSKTIPYSELLKWNR